jgi:putative flippase GtrA
MRLVRLLPDRIRAIAPEAMRFGAVGLGNTVLYFVIFNVTMGIGAVKATVIATVVTTTLSYLANRHWTYRHRPKTALRREYTLFFAFNPAGMVIQSGVVGIGKYGFGLSEDTDRLAFNIATCVGITLATAFRFWAYRTLVFRPADEPATVAANPVAEPASTAAASTAAAGAAVESVPEQVSVPEHVSAAAPTAPHPRTAAADHIDAPLPEINDPLDVELHAELAAAELDRAARPASS